MHKVLRPKANISLTTSDKRETLFDLGYNHGLLWGEIAGKDAPRNSWASKAQYKAGHNLGMQEHRKRKLQQLVLTDPS